MRFLSFASPAALVASGVFFHQSCAALTLTKRSARGAGNAADDSARLLLQLETNLQELLKRKSNLQDVETRTLTHNDFENVLTEDESVLMAVWEAEAKELIPGYGDDDGDAGVVCAGCSSQQKVCTTAAEFRARDAEMEREREERRKAGMALFSPRSASEEEEKTCTICYTNEKNLKLSCGHEMCSGCRDQMLSTGRTKCPTCDGGDLESAEQKRPTKRSRGGEQDEATKIAVRDRAQRLLVSLSSVRRFSKLHEQARDSMSGYAQAFDELLALFQSAQAHFREGSDNHAWFVQAHSREGGVSGSDNHAWRTPRDSGFLAEACTSGGWRNVAAETFDGKDSSFGVLVGRAMSRFLSKKPQAPELQEVQGSWVESYHHGEDLCTSAEKRRLTQQVQHEVPSYAVNEGILMQQFSALREAFERVEAEFFRGVFLWSPAGSAPPSGLSPDFDVVSWREGPDRILKKKVTVSGGVWMFDILNLHRVVDSLVRNAASRSGVADSERVFAEWTGLKRRLALLANAVRKGHGEAKKALGQKLGGKEPSDSEIFRVGAQMYARELEQAVSGLAARPEADLVKIAGKAAAELATSALHGTRGPRYDREAGFSAQSRRALFVAHGTNSCSRGEDEKTWQQHLASWKTEARELLAHMRESSAPLQCPRPADLNDDLSGVRKDASDRWWRVESIVGDDGERPRRTGSLVTPQDHFELGAGLDSLVPRLEEFVSMEVPEAFTKACRQVDAERARVVEAVDMLGRLEWRLAQGQGHLSLSLVSGGPLDHASHAQARLADEVSAAEAPLKTLEALQHELLGNRIIPRLECEELKTAPEHLRTLWTGLEIRARAASSHYMEAVKTVLGSLAAEANALGGTVRELMGVFDSKEKLSGKYCGYCNTAADADTDKKKKILERLENEQQAKWHLFELRARLLGIVFEVEGEGRKVKLKVAGFDFPHLKDAETSTLEDARKKFDTAAMKAHKFLNIGLVQKMSSELVNMKEVYTPYSPDRN